MSQDEEQNFAFSVFREWIGIQGYPHKRRFLQNHQELLNPAYRQEFSNRLARLKYPLEQRATYHKYVLLLQLAHTLGGDRQAIDTAFVNFFGGFALDIPDWLRQQFNALRVKSQDAEQYLSRLTSLLQQARKARDVPAEMVATLHIYQAQAFPNVASFHNSQRALEACQAALCVYGKNSLYPAQYALVQIARSNIYSQRMDGEQSSALDTAIQYALSAYEIFKCTDFPLEWASLCLNLGNYFLRCKGEQREENLRQAIHYYTQPLEIIPDLPSRLWAKLQLGLGEVYYAQAIETQVSIAQRAQDCFERVLNAHPSDEIQASASLHLGNTNVILDNLAIAVSCYQQALKYYTIERDLVIWATLQKNLGDAYARRPGYRPFGDPRLSSKRYDISRSCQHYQAALKIFQLETFTHHYRDIHSYLADMAVDEADWEKAHLHYQQALQAQKLLLQSSIGITSHDGILSDEKNLSTKDGYALLRLGRIEEATIALEMGRVRGLIQTFQLQVKPSIHDPLLRQRFATAQADLSHARQVLSALEAQGSFEQCRAEERLEAIKVCRRKQQEFSDVLRLVSNTSAGWTLLAEEQFTIKPILQAARLCGAHHALVYLAATYHGGIAIAAIANDTSTNDGHLYTLDLPELNYTLVRGLIQRTHSTRIIGGYAYIQGDEALSLICKQWPAETLQSCVDALHITCQKAGVQSTLEQAAQTLLYDPACALYVNLPFDSALWKEHKANIARQLSHLFLNAEFEHLSEVLAEHALRPLLAWLQKQGVHSTTLIPCGPLAALPLTAIPLDEHHCFADILPTSVATCARAFYLARAFSSSTSTHTRTGVYTLGDPRPTHQELYWGEAEAKMLWYLARRYDQQAKRRVQFDVTRRWLVETALKHGKVVSLSCHSQFIRENFLRSALLLARGERLQLSDLLNGSINLRGLRLLILSACQTQVFNLSGAYNEVRSLACGALQAGAMAVLGSLWPVNDHATFLLMTRFAQEWFPAMDVQAPAEALAQAQHWLRNITHRELAEWSAHTMCSYQFNTQSVLSTMLSKIHYQAQMHAKAAPDSRPYVSPYYWAGFQIIGW